MRALITGANGFMGRHLCHFLAEQGLEIHTTGAGDSTAPNHHRAALDDLERLAEIFEKVRPDYLFHLAGVVSSPDHALYYKVNTVFAATLLQAIEKVGLRDCVVLLVGTSAEYGLITLTDLPLVETTRPHPYNHYGISKLAQTHLGETFARQGYKAVMVRPFNIIGPGMAGHAAVQNFASQISQQSLAEGRAGPNSIKVGNLASSRDFLDIDEVVKIFWKLVQTPQAFGQIVNVCSGEAVSMQTILERLIQLSGIKLEIEVDPARFKPVDIPVHFGDPTRLSEFVGYVPGFDPDKSLIKIIKGLAEQ